MSSGPLSVYKPQPSQFFAMSDLFLHIGFRALHPSATVV